MYIINSSFCKALRLQCLWRLRKIAPVTVAGVDAQFCTCYITGIMYIFVLNGKGEDTPKPSWLHNVSTALTTTFIAMRKMRYGVAGATSVRLMQMCTTGGKVYLGAGAGTHFWRMWSARCHWPAIACEPEASWTQTSFQEMHSLATHMVFVLHHEIKVELRSTFMTEPVLSSRKHMRLLLYRRVYLPSLPAFMGPRDAPSLTD